MPASDRQAAHKRSVMTALADHPFEPSRAFGGGNRQTLYAPALRWQPPAPLELERWPTPDADLLRVHVAEGEPGRPVAILVHGLEGSVRSKYVIGLARRLVARGDGVVAMEHRSCGGELNRAPRLYHLGETTDLAFVVERCRERFLGRPLVAVGWSAGGNQIAKWLGEGAVPDELRAAAVVSAPFDLTVSAPHMDRVLSGFYTRRFLKTLIPKALAKERQYPGIVDAEAVKASRTFEAFDTHATAAMHGFDHCWHYWGAVSCGPFLPAVRTPLLLLSARDDPFNPGDTLPGDDVTSSPWLHPLFVQTGGHVGFVGRARGRRTYWAEDQVLRFLDAYAR